MSEYGKLEITFHDTAADMRERTKRIRRYNDLVRRGVRDDEYKALQAEMVEMGQVKE